MHGIRRNTTTGRIGKPFPPAIGRDIGHPDEAEAKTRGGLARTIALASMPMAAVTGG